MTRPLEPATPPVGQVVTTEARKPARKKKGKRRSRAPARPPIDWRKLLPVIFRATQGAIAIGAIGGAYAVFISWVPRSWLALAAASMFAGLALLLKVLVFDAAKEGRVYRMRREIALTVGTVFVSPLLLVIPALILDAGAVKAFMKRHERAREGEIIESFGDPEFGWAPHAPPQYVGQRLEVIDPTKPHIVMVGDSVWYGHGIEAPLIAATLVSQHYAPAYQGLNLSVSGWSPDQYYLYLKKTLPLVHSRLTIVAVFAGNDLQFTGREWNYGHSKPLFEMIDGTLTRTDSKAACVDGISQSVLYKLLWHAKDFAVNVGRLVCNPRELTMAQTEASASGIFDAIEGLGREHHTPILFMLLPVSDDWAFPIIGDRIKFTSKYKDLRRLLRDGGHALYEPYLDVARARLPVSELYIDPGHYTPRGHRIVADGLIRYVDAHYDLERGALREAAPPSAP